MLIDNKNQVATSTEDQLMQQRISELFGSNNRNCSTKESEEPTRSNPSIPYTKQDIYSAKNYGMSEDAYLIDYLSKLLKDNIIEDFQKIHKETLSLSSNDDYEDPYHLDNLYINLHAMNGSVTLEEAKKLSDEEKTKFVQQFLPKFELKAYKQGVRPDHINKACIKFKWDCKRFDNVNFAKRIVDLFDFNGVGYLNCRQFILASIILNADSAITNSCQENCYLKVVETKMLPIFAVADCDGDGKITQRRLIDTLPKLKGEFRKEYNIFLPCNAQHGSWRNNSIAKFVLNHTKPEHNGYLTQVDFVQGILLSFWNRHVTDKTIETGDNLNKIGTRWADKLKADNECQAINDWAKTKGISGSHNLFSSDAHAQKVEKENLEQKNE